MPGAAEMAGRLACRVADHALVGRIPQELRRHVEHFRESGKFAIAYLER